MVLGSGYKPEFLGRDFVDTNVPILGMNRSVSPSPGKHSNATMHMQQMAVFGSGHKENQPPVKSMATRKKAKHLKYEKNRGPTKIQFD